MQLVYLGAPSYYTPVRRDIALRAAAEAVPNWDAAGSSGSTVNSALLHRCLGVLEPATEAAMATAPAHLA